MTRTLNLQTCGSLVVIATFMASEAGARLLSVYPNSPFAWYVNLEVFRAFECARAEMSPLRHLFGPASLFVAFAVFIAALVARAAKHRFGVALLANLSFVFTISLALTWAGGASSYRAASLAPLPFGSGYDGMLLGLMLIVSFLAFAVSHAAFIAVIVAQRSARHA